jgi:hypothetical protein
MKQIICLLLVCLVAAPAWSAEKISVGELERRIQSFRDTGKSDQEVTTKLAEVALTETIPTAALNTLESLLPGQQSREQLNSLAVQSATLAPPAAEIPSLPAPDLATQKAIISKCVDYVTKVYMQNPHLAATKVTTYYGNGIRTFGPSDVYTYGRAAPGSFGPFGTHTMEIESENGVEKAPLPVNDKDWRASQLSAGPVLSFVLAQAAEGGHLAWQRWQLINGKPSAVFPFAVDKTRSRYEVNYCCFPKVEAMDIPHMGASQEVTSSTPFKTTVPFHGAFYIDPDTGTVLRLIMQAEFSPSDPVHREDTRIDYGPVKVEDKALIVPIRAYLQVALVPRGNNDTLGYAEDLNYSEAEFRNYRIVGSSSSHANR